MPKRQADRFRALYAANHDRVLRLLGRVAGRVSDPQSSPEQRLIRKQMREFIRGEIGRFPRANRAAFILGELGGLNDEEVAQALGIGLANAKVRLHRARAHLRTAIAARCDFYRSELSCAPDSPGCCPPAAPSNSSSTDHL